MIRKKISMLGSFAVGKTSLVRQFVHGIFSERYQTTIGVRVDKKDLVVGSTAVSLVLWDLHGEDEFQRLRSSYLRGSAGYFLVVDGTRRSTLEIALNLRSLALEAVGDVPFSVLVNKADVADSWEVTSDDLAGLRERGFVVIETSAKSGDAVERAFVSLAERMITVD